MFIARQPKLVRPANFPTGTPGRGATLIDTPSGRRVLVVNLLGRLFIDPLDDPFTAADREVGLCPLRQVADAILVDMHAEATSEKQAMAYHLDGTHTHVQTSDARIQPGGTAFMSDAGMCGDYESILGLDPREPVRRFIEKTPGARAEVASGEGTLSGLAIETDDGTGLASRIAAVRIGPVIEESRPGFWE